MIKSFRQYESCFDCDPTHIPLLEILSLEEANNNYQTLFVQVRYPIESIDHNLSIVQATSADPTAAGASRDSISYPIASEELLPQKLDVFMKPLKDVLTALSIDTRYRGI